MSAVYSKFPDSCPQLTPYKPTDTHTCTHTHIYTDFTVRSLCSRSVDISENQCTVTSEFINFPVSLLSGGTYGPTAFSVNMPIMHIHRRAQKTDDCEPKKLSNVSQGSAATSLGSRRISSDDFFLEISCHDVRWKKFENRSAIYGEVTGNSVQVR